jgi:hypothetical protein
MAEKLAEKLRNDLISKGIETPSTPQTSHTLSSISLTLSL